MDPEPVHGELELGAEDPGTLRTMMMTSPSAAHPFLSCGQSRNLTPCSKFEEY